jgi:hypothetical protein
MRRPALTKRAGGCPAALPTVEERAVKEEEMEVG